MNDEGLRLVVKHLNKMVLDIGNDADALKQVVTLQGEAIKDLIADVKALKEYKQGRDAIWAEAGRRLAETEPLETPRMYAEDMDWKEGEEEENKLLRHAIAFKLPRSTDLKELRSNLCNNQWLRQKAISLGIDVSHIKETV